MLVVQCLNKWLVTLCTPLMTMTNDTLVTFLHVFLITTFVNTVFTYN